MLDRIPSSPPKIDPLPECPNRPLWSVMIPTYNCINFLRETLSSVLEQAPPPEEMQIEVVDDHSTDGDVEALVKELGNGRVQFFKQPKNVGSLRNFETCINRAKGKRIHILHGDDAVNPGFYEEIDSLFNAHPHIGAAFTNCNTFDENSEKKWKNPTFMEHAGVVPNFLYKLVKSSAIETPSIVVKRSVYEHLGSFYGVHYGEDWEMWTRIAAHYEMAYSPKPLVNYRIHSKNITGNSFLTAQNIRDIDFVINTFQNYLPQERKKTYKKEAKREYALYISNQVVNRIYHEQKNPTAAVFQARKIFEFYPSILTLFCFAKVSFKKLIKYKAKPTVYNK